MGEGRQVYLSEEEMTIIHGFIMDALEHNSDVQSYYDDDPTGMGDWDKERKAEEAKWKRLNDKLWWITKKRSDGRVQTFKNYFEWPLP